MNKVINAKRINWVKSMVSAFLAEEAANPLTVGTVVVDRKVSILYLDIENPKIGVAKCNPSDRFDLETGIAIAYARANNKGIPDYVLNDGVPFKSLGIGARFEWKGKTLIKLDKDTVYCYNDGRTYTSDGTEYVNVIND